MDIRKSKLTKKVVGHWNKMPGEVVESLTLEVFKKCADILRDVV